MGRIWIEYLQHTKPNEQNKKRGKHRTKHFCAPGPNIDKQGQVHQSNQNILGKINHHIVAEKLAGQIFKENPDKKRVKSETPISENSYCGYAGHEPQKVVLNGTQVLDGNSIADYPCQPDTYYKEAQSDQSLIFHRGSCARSLCFTYVQSMESHMGSRKRDSTTVDRFRSAS